MIPYNQLEDAVESLAINMIERTVRGIAERATSRAKKAWQKHRSTRMSAYKRYLKSAVEQYCWQKTFLNKHAPQYIYDFYVPLKIKVVAYEQIHGSLSYKYLDKKLKAQVKNQRMEIINRMSLDMTDDEVELPFDYDADFDQDDLDEYMLELESRGYHGESELLRRSIVVEREDIEDTPPHFILSGQAGCGKSTAMRHLFLDTIGVGEAIPVLIELRDRNDSEATVWSLIIDQIAKRDHHFDDDTITDTFAKGLVFLLIDGLDEVDTSHAIKAEKEIQEIAEKFPKCTIVLSSRPYTAFSSWHTFLELEMLPLDLVDADSLAKSAPIDKAIIRKFRRDLNSNIFNKEQSFLSNPLLLSIMILTYNETADIPNSLHNFYEQAYYALYNRHDATKGAYTREKESGLAVDEFASLLDAFCLITYWKNKTKFKSIELHQYLDGAKNIAKRRIQYENENVIADLRKALGILVPQGHELVFSHRSFQEYFTARYLSLADLSEAKKICEHIEVRIEQDNVIKMFADMNPFLFEGSYVIPLISELLETIDYQGSITKTIYVRYLQQIADRVELIGGRIYVRGHLSKIIAFIRSQYDRIEEYGGILSGENDADKSARQILTFTKTRKRKVAYDTNELHSRHTVLPVLMKNSSIASEANLKFLIMLRKRLVKESEAKPKGFDEALGINTSK